MKNRGAIRSRDELTAAMPPNNRSRPTTTLQGYNPATGEWKPLTSGVVKGNRLLVDTPQDDSQTYGVLSVGQDGSKSKARVIVVEPSTVDIDESPAEKSSAPEVGGIPLTPSATPPASTGAAKVIGDRSGLAPVEPPKAAPVEPQPAQSGPIEAVPGKPEPTPSEEEMPPNP